MRLEVLLACLAFSFAATPLARAAEDTAPVAIELRPHAPQWEVRYALPQPMRELRFERTDRKGTRMATWTPVDARLRITMEGEEEVVRRADGKPFRRAAFRMAPRYIELEKDYAPFSPFGDGGLLVYTGRLHACADKCTGKEKFRVTLRPPHGAHAIVRGNVVARVDFVDDSEGTNLYVGQAEPVSTPDLVAVIDPTLPAAVRTRLDSLLPRLMAFYGREFGALAQRPMLFASNDAAHPGGGFGYQGGTLPGQVFVHRYGSNPAFDTADFAARQDWFFAHEAAHLYQRYPALGDENDSWIHEGGADALAALALRALGVVDEAAVQARLQTSLDACAKGIARHPLDKSVQAGEFDLFYSCGFVLQMAIDAAARRASAGKCGLACVWRDFQARVAAGDAWTGATFLAVAASHTDPATASFLHSATTQSSAQSLQPLSDGLRAAGWNLPASAAPTR